MIDFLRAVLNAMILAESPSSLSMLVIKTLRIIGRTQDIDTSLSVEKKTIATSNGSSNLAISFNKTH